MRKGRPIPVRFDEDEARAIAELQEQTELSASEIIRRAVRFLDREKNNQGDATALMRSLRGPKGGISPIVGRTALAASKAPPRTLRDSIKKGVRTLPKKPKTRVS